MHRREIDAAEVKLTVAYRAWRGKTAQPPSVGKAERPYIDKKFLEECT